MSYSNFLTQRVILGVKKLELDYVPGTGYLILGIIFMSQIADQIGVENGFQGLGVDNGFLGFRVDNVFPGLDLTMDF